MMSNGSLLMDEGMMMRKMVMVMMTRSQGRLDAPLSNQQRGIYGYIYERGDRGELTWSEALDDEMYLNGR
jgi:hypothetical protein